MERLGQVRFEAIVATSALAATQQRQSSPWRMNWPAWKSIVVRTWREASDDNVGIVAAGVAFYGFLALVPLLGAIVLSYGLVAEPRTVVDNVRQLTGVMPAEAAKLIGQQLLNVVHQSGGKKGLGLVVALAIALFGARNAAGSIITALNIAYEEKERRSFLVVNLLALAMTAAAVVVALLALLAVAALGFLQDLVPDLPGIVVALGKIVAYVLLVLAAAASAATLYRYGPSREEPRWQWITPGSLFTAVTWLILTLLFGIYVSSFASYDKTYGSLGAVIVLLTWMYLSSYVLLVGAELNSEVEHQAASPGQTALRAEDVRPAPSEPCEVPPEQARPPAMETDPVPAEVAYDAPPLRNGYLVFGDNYLTVRATSSAGRMMGLRGLGLLTSTLSAAGLLLIGKRGRTAAGIALLGSAAGLRFLNRD